MKPLVIFLMGALCGTAITAGVHHSHLVRTSDQWLIVPRAGVNLKDVYADVRSWSLEDWRSHPDLARNMVKAGHAEVIQQGAVEQLTEAVKERITDRDEADYEVDSEPAALPRTTRALRRQDDFEPDSQPY